MGRWPSPGRGRQGCRKTQFGDPVTGDRLEAGVGNLTDFLSGRVAREDRSISFETELDQGTVRIPVPPAVPYAGGIGDLVRCGSVVGGGQVDGLLLVRFEYFHDQGERLPLVEKIADHFRLDAVMLGINVGFTEEEVPSLCRLAL